MSRPRPTVPLFGMSFLDVVFCALGGVVMLLMYMMQSTSEEGQSYRNAAAALQGEIQTQEEAIDTFRGQIAQLTDDLGSRQSEYDRETGRLSGELERARAGLRQTESKAVEQIAGLEAKVDESQEALTIARRQNATDLAVAADRLAEEKQKAAKDTVELRGEIGELRRAVSEGDKRHGEVQQAMVGQTGKLAAQLQEALDEVGRLHGKIDGVIGLRGPMKNVAFVFDTSASMGSAARAKERFPAYKKLLKAWVSALDFGHFNVVRFYDGVETRQGWEDVLIEASPQNRDLACAYIDGFHPAGTTNTMGALRYALDTLPDVGTIIIFSDGQPNAPDGSSNGGKPAIDWILAYLHENNRGPTGKPRVTINTVAMGDYLSQAYGEFLRDLAEQNGGVFIGR